MNKTVFFLLLSLLLGCVTINAQEAKKSELEQRADAEKQKGSLISARYSYIRAYEDYVRKGQTRKGVESGAKAVALYYQENLYQEAFDLARNIDQTIEAIDKQAASAVKASMHYLVSKERMQMYLKMRRAASTMEHLNIMERYANLSSEEEIKNDLLYNKAIYYYTFGQQEKGNAVFKEMASKLTASKEYDKVDEVYKTLIANGRRSNNASLVAQSYRSYMQWKDSVSALKLADETGALKQRIAENEASIAEKDSKLSTRAWVIGGLGVLVGILAAALAVGAFVMLRFIMLTRKQKNTIKQVNENNALKAQFISNIASQLEPTLRKLDQKLPEVKALTGFTEHIQTLSELECNSEAAVEKEDTKMPPYCEGVMDEVRKKAKSGINLTVNAPNMSAKINKEYVSHILTYLLNNAIEFTPEGGTVSLEFKKRGVNKYQFLVSDSGPGIPEEKREDVFKPFLEVRDLTQGDGLGLPICRQMAMKMGGDLSIDPSFNKGARFVLDLYA